MRLLCHIGTPKTASTLLQRTAQSNAEYLLERGVLYPDLLTPYANHITLMYASIARPNAFARGYGLKTQEQLEAFRVQMSERLGEVIAGAPSHVHTLLVSSENLAANMHRPGVRNFIRLMEPHVDDMEVLVYLRRQDQSILSMYAEFMRKGFSNHTFDEFIDFAFDPKKGPPYLQYRRMLTHWRETLGPEKVTVRLFDRDHLRDGSILSDFFSRVVPPEEVEGLTPSTSGNVSLSAPALEFLRQIQPHVPFARHGDLNPARQALGRKVDSLPHDPRPQMSTEQSNRIMRHFAEDNAWLRETCFPDMPEPLFPFRSEEETPSNMGHVGLRDFASFTGHLLK